MRDMFYTGCYGLKMKLGIIGTGNMAEALISGMVGKKVLPASHISGFDLNISKLRSIQKKYRIHVTSSLVELIQKNDLILLAVKPQQMGELLDTIKPHLSQKHILLSIAAGLDTHFISKKTGGKIPIIRLMPNTPALIGWGATAFFANKRCSQKQIQFTKKLFEAVGLVIRVKQEELLDAVTALSGSGPAFAYRFIDELAQGGKEGGLDFDTALTLAIQTVAGAALMLAKTGEHPQDLVAKVTSKGGTTLAGLKILQQRKFGVIVRACLQAARKRAKELRLCLY